MQSPTSGMMTSGGFSIFSIVKFWLEFSNKTLLFLRKTYLAKILIAHIGIPITNVNATKYKNAVRLKGVR
ncbi:hypothetical protein GCM10009433_05490 [Psychroflexus lacisalsi]|uniref:Uncharacterized protein n=1 Tax=Psychroflexus lacisalsi TaxID=503928 RepID=A0ABN1K2Z8_9FLAO